MPFHFARSTPTPILTSPHAPLPRGWMGGWVTTLGGKRLLSLVWFWLFGVWVVGWMVGRVVGMYIYMGVYTNIYVNIYIGLGMVERVGLGLGSGLGSGLGF